MPAQWDRTRPGLLVEIRWMLWSYRLNRDEESYPTWLAEYIHGVYPTGWYFFVYKKTTFAAPTFDGVMKLWEKIRTRDEVPAAFAPTLRRVRDYP